GAGPIVHLLGGYAMAILAQTKPAAPPINRVARLATRLVQWGIALAVTVLVAFPTWPIIYQSFLREPLYNLEQALTLENYPRVLTNPAIWRGIGNTLIFMVGSTLVGTAIGILFAVLLTRTDVPGRALFAKLI